MFVIALVAFTFAALPAVLSIRARRYTQAALVFLACLAAPFIVGVIAIGVSDPQYSNVQGELAFLATAVLFPLFCASVLWERGKFKAAQK